MDSGAAFDFILQKMPVGLVVWQLDVDLQTLRLAAANPAAERLVGAHFARHIGETIGELFPHVPAERHRQYVEIANSSDQGSIVRLEDTRSEHTTFSVRALAMPERCVGIIFQDLTDQVAELTKREERFHTLLKNSADAIVLSDAQGRLLYATDSVTRILGYRPEDLNGREAFGDVHPDDLQHTHRLLGRLMAEPTKPATAEVRVRHVDGSYRQLEFVITNCLDDPNVGALVNNFRDITERKRVEEALHKTEEQLRQSQKMEAIGRLAGGIAHDFNNLLSVVLSYADLMLEIGSASGVREEIIEIKKAGTRAAELTHQLLAFSRQQVLEPQVVNLNEVLSSMESMIRRLIGEDIDLRFVLSQHIWKTRVDPGQIEQVLMNLVVNARDAMPNGGSLTIETANVVLDEAYAATHVEASTGPHVMFAVSDTGVGMDRATQARVFDPFFTTKEKGKGTGLGLATAFGIVKQSGGSIFLYSELDAGTTFKVYLPQTEAPRASDRPSSMVLPAPRGTETVLVVEDDPSVRQVTSTILTLQGYRVLVAASGEEAIGVAHQHDDIRLLVTDVVMPKMSGKELALALLAFRPTLKVLYVSGYTDNTIVHHGVLDEGVEFLQKPITPGALTRKVRAVLDS